MKGLFCLLLLLIPNTTRVNAQPRRETQPAPIVFTHVVVIDPADGSLQPNMMVVILGNHIAQVGKDEQIKVPNSARLVDGRRKFLIPGLWDMHVHIFSGGRFPTASRLLIANGITGVREMGTFVPLATINGIRKQITEGTVLGPRIVAAGPVVDGGFKDWTNLNVTTESEARVAVRSLKQQGADFIKVYDSLSRAAYFAVADESKKQGISFVGHVPYAVTPGEASEAGQKSIEHLTGIVAACSTEEAEIRREYDEAWREPDFSIANVKGARADIRAADTFSFRRCTQLANVFRGHHTWQCPTLVLQRNGTYDVRSLGRDWRLKYIPKEWLSAWAGENDIFMKAFTAADQAGWAQLYRTWIEVVGILHRAGAEFLAGSDLGTRFIYPGFSLHDELELLVSAGFTPLQALQAATWNPARFLGMENLLGRVEPGKLADLVLLDANPLEDIRNARKIRAVVLNGKYFDRAALDNLLAEAARNAR